VTDLPANTALAAAVRSVLPNARAAWLFGSAAAGRWQPGSDIDVAVDMPEPMNFNDRWEAAQDLAAKLGAHVDLLDFRRLHTVMQVQILGSGLLLFTNDIAATAAYGGFVYTEYQHIQRWRQPMLHQLADRLSAASLRSVAT